MLIEMVGVSKAYNLGKQNEEKDRGASADRKEE